MGLVATAEVIERHVQSHGGSVIVERLTESIGKPGESAKMHSYGQIRSFDMRRRDAAEIRSADFDVWDSSQNPARAVPVRRGDFVVDFMKLREFNFLSVPLADRADIGVKLVARDLVAANGALSKIASDAEGVDAGPCADNMADNQLRLAVQRQPQEGAAPLGGVVVPKVVIFRVNESPHLIKLHVSGADILDFGVKQRTRLLRCRVHERKNRLLVQARESGNGANAHPFEHQSDSLRELLRVRRMRGPDICGSVRVGKRGTAGSAAVSLDFPLAIGSESLAGLVFASNAGHGVSPLAFCGETSQNNLWSEAWVPPRFGLAPTPASTEAGALTQLFNWWRQHRHLRFATAWRLDYVGPFVFESIKSFLSSPKGLTRLVFAHCGHPGRAAFHVDHFAAAIRFLFNFLRFRHSFKNHVNGGLRILVFAQVAPQTLQLALYFMGTQPNPILRSKHSPNLIRECRTFEHSSRFVARVNVHALTLANHRESLNGLAHNHQSFPNLLLLGKQLGQFLFSRVVSSAVIGGLCHA